MEAIERALPFVISSAFGIAIGYFLAGVKNMVNVWKETIAEKAVLAKEVKALHKRLDDLVPRLQGTEDLVRGQLKDFGKYIVESKG